MISGFLHTIILSVRSGLEAVPTSPLITRITRSPMLGRWVLVCTTSLSNPQNDESALQSCHAARGPGEKAVRRQRNQLGNQPFHGPVSRRRRRGVVFLYLESSARRSSPLVDLGQPGHWHVLSPAAYSSRVQDP